MTPDLPAEKSDYLTAREVMQLLDIRRQTLYAYVSRGWISSIGQAGQKERLYSRGDAERVLSRSRRIIELKRANQALDARIATRAVEIGEMKSELAETRADRVRLIASIQALNDQVERLAMAG